jgi:uncharacterized protein (TIGR00369 family)
MTERNIWKGEATIEEVNALARDTLLAHLGITFTEIGDDFLRGSMPVDGRTRQPYGILHGGASVALAETLGSMAANLCIDRNTRICVGLSISANHIKRVSEGTVTGTARPVHLGGRTQLWDIRIEDESGDLVSTSRLTMLVMDRKA